MDVVMERAQAKATQGPLDLSPQPTRPHAPVRAPSAVHKIAALVAAAPASTHLAQHVLPLLEPSNLLARALQLRAQSARLVREAGSFLLVVLPARAGAGHGGL